VQFTATSATPTGRFVISVNYFAYGSNLLGARLAARVPIGAEHGVLRLTGWSLRWHKRGRDGSAKCDLVETGRDDDVAWGFIYQLNRAAASELDRIEGVGSGYAVRELAIADRFSARLYVAEAAYIDPARLPYAWYRDLVVAGARSRGFPEDYVAALARVPAHEDPDLDRARRHQALLGP
jgi:gamma-glutamylcyclotransferase